MRAPEERVSGTCSRVRDAAPWLLLFVFIVAFAYLPRPRFNMSSLISLLKQHAVPLFSITGGIVAIVFGPRSGLSPDQVQQLLAVLAPASALAALYQRPPGR